MLIPQLAYTLTEAEARARFALRPPAQRWFSVGYIVLGCVSVAFGVARLLLQPSPNHLFGSSQIVFGITYLCVGVYPLLKFRSNTQREFALSFSADGVVFTTPTAAVVPWMSVRSVEATSDVFVFRCTKRRTFVLPKRVLHDGGDGLWQALAGRLIASYRLVRRRDSRLIVNTVDL